MILAKLLISTALVVPQPVAFLAPLPSVLNFQEFIRGADFMVEVDVNSIKAIFTVDGVEFKADARQWLTGKVIDTPRGPATHALYAVRVKCSSKEVVLERTRMMSRDSDVLADDKTPVVFTELYPDNFAGKFYNATCQRVLGKKSIAL